MEKLDRWAFRHFKGCFRAIVLLWMVLAIAGQVVWDWPMLFAVLIYLVGTFACLQWLGSCGTRLLRGPLAILKEHCDPYPLLREMEAELKYSLYPANKQMIQVNYAMALQQAGEYEKAFAQYNDIHIDKYHLSPQMKVVYYNNLADLCFWMGKLQEADIWYEKMLQIFQDMKPGKAQEQLRPTVEANRALHHFCNGEYDRVLLVLERKNPIGLSGRVEDAMLYARTYLAMGEKERSIKPLQFVAENGNKLHFAMEARTLLAEINTEETI